MSGSLACDSFVIARLSGGSTRDPGSVARERRSLAGDSSCLTREEASFVPEGSSFARVSASVARVSTSFARDSWSITRDSTSRGLAYLHPPTKTTALTLFNREITGLLASPTCETEKNRPRKGTWTMTTKKAGKNSRATLAGQLVAGTKKNFPDMTQKIMVGGVSMTVGDATNELQAFVDNRAAVVAAQVAAKAKLEAERSQMPALNAFLDAFVAFIRGTFGTKTDLLSGFGLEPPQAKAQPTAEEKAVAVAKRTATRKARGTSGTKAKKAVHGNVTATLTVTPEAPPAPTPPAPATPAQK